MRISTVREFRDNATGLLKSPEPVLITRRGRMAGIFFRLQKAWRKTRRDPRRRR